MSGWELGFYLRVIASVGIFAAGIAVAYWLWNKVGFKSLLAYYGIRIVGMLGLVVVFRQIPPDVDGWYSHGLWMMSGHIPGVDFLSPYHFGFNALLALATLIFRNPIGIVIMLSLAELLAIILLYKALSPLYGDKLVRRSLIMYLSSPIVFFQSFLGAQDETLLLLGIAVILYCVVKQARISTIFISLFFTIVFTKILAVFYLFPFSALKRYKGVFALLFGVGLYLGTVFLFGINPVELHFGRELGLNAASDKIAEMVTVGNVWYLFPRVGGVVPAVTMLLFLGLSSITVLKYFVKPNYSLKTLMPKSIYLFTVWMLLFSLFYKMTFASYLIPVIPFICLLMLTSRKLFAVGVVWHCLNGFKDPLSYGFKAMRVMPGHVVNTMSAILAIVVTVVLVVLVYRVSIVEKTLGIDETNS